MKPTWKFFGGLAGGFLLASGLTLLAFYLNLGVPTGTSGWAYELNHRKQLAAEQTASPKLLVVGGSATLFGISARTIQEQTGWPTVNLSTHAALGTAYILHLAQAAAKPGDTVLLVLEYELYNYGKVSQTWADKLLVDYVVSRDPAFFRRLSPGEQWSVFMLTSYPRLLEGLKNRLRAEEPYQDEGRGLYSVGHLNAWGDLTRHTEGHRLADRSGIRKLNAALGRGLPEHPEGLETIAAFCAWARTNDVRVLATFPNLCDQPGYHGPTAARSARIITDFFSQIGVPVIGVYTDALLPEEQFLDTMYHTSEEASVKRTERLILRLKPALEDRGRLGQPAPGPIGNLGQARLRPQAGPDRLQVSRRIARSNTLQGERRICGAVHPRVCRAGGLIPGGGDEIAHRFIPVTERIAEVPDWPTERILELLAAGSDFLPRNRDRQASQPWVAERMRPNCMAGTEPFADLDFVHHALGRFAFGNIPNVMLAEQIGDQELDGR
jgi:hypothetical protein